MVSKPKDTQENENTLHISWDILYQEVKDQPRQLQYTWLC